MIRFPPPWRQMFGANVVTAERDGARATFHQRFVPQRSASTIVGAMVTADREFVALDIETKRVVTADGEYATSSTWRRAERSTASHTCRYRSRHGTTTRACMRSKAQGQTRPYSTPCPDPY